MGVPISNVTRRVVYAASGTGPYAFTFEILANTDIAVYRDDTLLTLTTDYTVTIAANGTGSITLVAAPTGATQIAIVGNRTIQRTTDFVTGGDFFANTINNEMDQQTIFAQQNAEGLARSMQAPQTDPTSINMTLPRASVRAGKYLSFDNDGNPVAAEGRTEVAAVYAIRDEIVTVAGIDDQVIAVAGNATNVNTVAGISSNVTTVAGISANVTTVAGNNANVTSVAGNATNINTVAGSIANVNNVGGSISSVNTVAGELGAGQDVTVVAANLGGTDTIGTVAGSIANVDAVGTNISNVNAVNSNATNINTVAGQITPTNNVSAVAAVASSVATVAGISSGVTTVAGISANVTTVAGVSANVTTVAGSIGSVNTVSGSIASVNTNATNIANINANAANITAIQNASANATAAAASAASASTQANNAAASAAAASAVVLGNEPVRPLIRPSLLLDFANTEQLDPRITFTRASTATYYGTQTAKAEENLLLQSQTFDNAIWIKTAVTVTANADVAPDGTSTADKIIGTATTGFHACRQDFTYTTGLVYTLSVFAKAAEYSNLIIADLVSGTFACTFDLSAGTAGTPLGGAPFTSVTASIQNIGSGWYRCVLTGTSNTSALRSPSFVGYPAGATLSANGAQYTGDGTSGILLWGAQLEQRSAVTAYTPTTTAPITNYIPRLLTAASGVARFDHNPTTFESLGLEIEESRTNLVVRSEEFDNSGWTKTNSTITANTIVSPDGTLNADKHVPNSGATIGVGASSTRIYQSPSVVSGTAYVLTLYAKAAEYDQLQLAVITTPTLTATFSLTAGTVVSGTGATITLVGNGWYRCSLPFTADITGGQQIRLSAFSSTTSTGNGYSGIYIWGAQLEAGAFATSYIPTVASQVTRAADAASMTGTNFSSWYNAEEGTMYAEANTPSFATTYVFAEINNNSTSNYIRHSTTSVGTTTQFVVVDGTVTQASPGFAVTLGSYRKMAGAYTANSVQQSVNGSLGTEDTSATIPTNLVQINIGSRAAGTSAVNGTISKIAYYPLRVTNAQLQALTTV